MRGKTLKCLFFTLFDAAGVVLTSPVCGFLQRRTFRGRGVALSNRGSPMDLQLHEKNERAALSDRKPIVPNFKVSGQPMTSDVRANTYSGPPDTTIFGML